MSTRIAKLARIDPRGPGPRVVVLACLLGACTPSEATLVVQVRTDLAPGLELGSVRVVVEGGPTRDTAASSARDWGLGVRVAELALPRGTHRLRVAALDGDGAVVVERPVRAELSGGVRVVTVLLTRDCAGVRCPGPGDTAEATACVGGRCVLASCVEEAAGDCATECASAASCGAASAACAAVECTASGTCFETPDHAECAASEVCVLGDGCVPMDGADGGVPVDAGTCDSVPCGLFPPCGCGAGEGCRYSPTTGLACEAAGAGAEGEPCAVAADCEAGLHCFDRGRRCARYCRTDAECPAGAACVFAGAGEVVGLCVGDACDPVAGGPCPMGQTCRLGAFFDALGERVRQPFCEVYGATNRNQPCALDTDCGPGLACAGGFCRPYCDTLADCASPGTICLPTTTGPFPPPGECSDVCDVLDGSGCGSGATCRVRQARDIEGGLSWGYFCDVRVGTGGEGASCMFFEECVAGYVCINLGAGGNCRQLCDVSAPRCALGACNEPMPELVVGSARYGACF